MKTIDEMALEQCGKDLEACRKENAVLRKDRDKHLAHCKKLYSELVHAHELIESWQSILDRDGHKYLMAHTMTISELPK
jgi:hypothetical protein